MSTLALGMVVYPRMRFFVISKRNYTLVLRLLKSILHQDRYHPNAHTHNHHPAHQPYIPLQPRSTPRISLRTRRTRASTRRARTISSSSRRIERTHDIRAQPRRRSSSKRYSHRPNL